MSKVSIRTLGEKEFDLTVAMAMPSHNHIRAKLSGSSGVLECPPALSHQHIKRPADERRAGTTAESGSGRAESLIRCEMAKGGCDR